MAHVMTDEERIRANEAAYILDSAVFREAFEDLDARYVKEWRGATDSAAREMVWQRQRVLRDMKADLLNIIQSAAFADGGKEFAEKVKKVR